MSVRAPTHAGSWYEADAATLSAQLTGWLSDAQATCGRARAIIAPHAGYSYSGPTAAWAYRHIQTEGVQRVFLLGPSHNLYTPKCLLSTCVAYMTPLGGLAIDQEVYTALRGTGQFDYMQLKVDEREHSLEMHLPYIAHIMGDQKYTLVPIMVGALSEEAEARYGELLAPYLADPANLFVISSDFCHWGERFGFKYHDGRHGEIYQSIEALDHEGMALIEAQDPAGFAQYLREYNNTICGRHPIAVLLNALKALTSVAPQAPAHSVKFVRYAQSSRCRRPDDSSVSYASAIVWAC